MRSHDRMLATVTTVFKWQRKMQKYVLNNILKASVRFLSIRNRVAPSIAHKK